MGLCLPAFHFLVPPCRDRMFRWKHGLVFLTQMGHKEKPVSVLPLWQAGCLETGSGTRARLTCSQNAVKEPKQLTQVKSGVPRTQSQAGLPTGNLVIWKSYVKRGLKIQKHSSEIRKPESRVWRRESWCSGFYGMLTLVGWEENPQAPRDKLCGWEHACLKIIVEMWEGPLPLTHSF